MSSSLSNNKDSQRRNNVSNSEESLVVRKEKPLVGTPPPNNILQYFIRKPSKGIDKESKSNHRVMMPLQCILKHNLHEKLLESNNSQTNLNTKSTANLSEYKNQEINYLQRRDSVSSSDSSTTEDISSSSLATSVNPSLKCLSMKESDFGNVNFVREAFLDYLSEKKVLGVENANVKLLYLDHFYKVTRPYSKKSLESENQVVQLVEQFCKGFVNLNMDSYIIDMELIEEKIHSGLKYPYLDHLSGGMNFSPLMHEYLELVMIDICKKLLRKSSSSSEKLSPSENIVEEDDFLLKEINEKLQLVSEMFYTELQDLFYCFQAHKKYRSIISVWLKKGIDNQTIPIHVLDIYKKKLEGDEKAINNFKFTDEDFLAKNIIDKDWSFVKYFSRDVSTDWFMTCKDQKYVQWSTKTEYSYKDKDLRASKLIGYVDYPLENIVKSFNTEKHLNRSFSSLKFHEYLPINEASSIQKYPSGILTSRLEFGPLIKKRSVKLIFSTKTKFIGDEMSEFILFYKSCDYQQSGKDIPVTVIGARVFTKLDSNRTRFLQVRMGNLGGLLNSSLIIHNKLSFKKMAAEEFGKLIEMILISEKEGFPMPILENNYLMRIWVDYCKHYCRVNVLEKYK